MKTYTTPVAKCITLSFEGMIAESLTYDTTKTGSQNLSNQRDASSNIWGDED